MWAVEINEVRIYCDDRFAGRLRRTTHGSVFEYEDFFLSSENKPPHGIARHLPYSSKRHETSGVNLHTFFAGLLPEGIRLQSIIAKARTSPDDLFTLLIEAGPDCVGNVYAVVADDDIQSHRFAVELNKIHLSDFNRIEKSLYEDMIDASIPGVQPKLSASTIAMPLQARSKRIPAILKLSPPAYPKLVENEFFFLNLAKSCGLKVPSSKIVTDANNRTGLLVTRFDRYIHHKTKKIHRIYQEDSTQLCDRYPSDKYRLSIQEITDELFDWCDAPKIATMKLLQLYMYSYLIGNSDLHAKNISVFKSLNTSQIELTPCYDLICTLAYSKLDKRMALKFDGKDDNFTLNDFLKFGERYRVPEKPIKSFADKMINVISKNLNEVYKIGFDNEVTRSIQLQTDECLEGL